MGILQLPYDNVYVYAQTCKLTRDYEVALLESSNCYDEFKAKRLADGMVPQLREGIYIHS